MLTLSPGQWCPRPQFEEAAEAACGFSGEERGHWLALSALAVAVYCRLSLSHGGRFAIAQRCSVACSACPSHVNGAGTAQASPTAVGGSQGKPLSGTGAQDLCQ